MPGIVRVNHPKVAGGERLPGYLVEDLIRGHAHMQRAVFALPMVFGVVQSLVLAPGNLQLLEFAQRKGPTYRLQEFLTLSEQRAAKISRGRIWLWRLRGIAAVHYRIFVLLFDLLLRRQLRGRDLRRRLSLGLGRLVEMS